MPLTSIATSTITILDHHLAATAAQPDTVVLRDAVTGWSWGWCHDPEPRFHLVPLDPDQRRVGRVDLEDRYGRRVFEPTGEIPPGVLARLDRLVTRHRRGIEAAWCRQVAGMGWLHPLIEPDGLHIRLVVYEGTSCERTRWLRVNWPMLLQGRDPEPGDVEVDAEQGDLVVAAREAEPVRVPLRLLVLVGRTSVFDGLAIAEPDPATMQ